MTIQACMAAFAFSMVGVDGDADKTPLPANIVKAWRDAGAEMKWMVDTPPDANRAYHFWRPWRDKPAAGAMPAFRFPDGAKVNVGDLPDPGAAFGLDFHCGWQTGTPLTDMVKHKNLQSLNIGARLRLRGDDKRFDMEVADLAGAKNLRALYLFHTQLRDDGLKELSGLTNLQTLDLYATRVTDAGLRALDGMKHLQALNLGCTKVTDAGIKQLARHKSLRWLSLRATDVTAAAIANLQKELPHCTIDGPEGE